MYNNLSQNYESEFSAITLKKPNEKGLFSLDTPIDEETEGLLFYVDKLPAGMAALRTDVEGVQEICEFYIIPCYRRLALGKHVALQILKKRPGFWQIKQIAGTDYATCFWRKVVSEFTQNHYEEDVYNDARWGKVTRQRFRC